MDAIARVLQQLIYIQLKSVNERKERTFHAICPLAFQKLKPTVQ